MEKNVYSLMKQIVKTAKILKNKYHVVCTNPPYLNKYNPKLKKFVEGNYKDGVKILGATQILKNSPLKKRRNPLQYNR